MTLHHRSVGRRGRAAALLAVLLAAATAVPSTSAAPPANVDVPLVASTAARPLTGRAALLAPLVTATAGAARIAADGVDGAVTFVGSSASRPLAPARSGDPGDIARTFLDRYASAFGVASSGDLVEDRRTVGLDATGVRFRQHVRGVPVLAGEIVVSVARNGQVTSTSGEAAPDLALDTSLDTRPTVAASTARTTAIAVVARGRAADAASSAVLDAATPELLVYDPRLLRPDAARHTRLVWKVVVRNGTGDVDRLVLVDAHTGGIALQFDQVESAKNRVVCDFGNVSVNDPRCLVPIRTEGSGTSAVADVESAFTNAGLTYDFYANVLGRDSIDGAGLTLRSSVRVCLNGASCPYQNAFWDDGIQQMVYGLGFASGLDVVGHELTHGVTNRTSNLLYYAQSGAINESMSDVMGELIQLAQSSTPAGEHQQWLQGESLSIGAIRSMSNPPAFSDPDRMTSPNYSTSPSDGFGVHTNSGVNNKAAYLMAEGGTFNGQTITGIGELKTARVYYQAQTTLLTPGSDYLDLAYALPQACTALVGSNSITAADCTSVSQAMLATEMFTRPTAGGLAQLLAPQCADGHSTAAPIFGDDFEHGGGNWLAAVPGAGSAAAWGITSASSQSGTHSMWAPDPSVASQAKVTLATPLAIPAAGTTLLSFDHSYDFDHDTNAGGIPVTFYDGGQVGISTTGAAGPFTSIGAPGPSVRNGYDHVLAVSTNPSSGQAAFAADSPGYVRTVIDLSAYAGQTVTLGFFLGSDGEAGADGWFVDDVSVYQCAPLTAPTTAFTSVGPARLFDTRPDGFGVSPLAPVTPAAPLTFQVGGFSSGGSVLVPTSGVAAVSLNVAVTNPVAAGFITVYPCGDVPFAANVNFGAHQTVSNAVVAPVSSDGRICFATSQQTDLVVDVNGWFASSTGFVATGPLRLFDTRPGNSPDAKLTVVKVPVGPAGLGVVVASTPGSSLPASGIGAVTLNVAVTNPVAAGFVTVYPCGTPPFAANLNFVAGQTISNAVVAPVSASGTVCFLSSVNADLVVDISGWFPSGQGLAPVGPYRLFDTRGASTNALVPVVMAPVADAPLVVQVAGLSDAHGTVTPATGIGAVSLNVAVTNPAAAGFVTVYPCGQRPLVASVNYAKGETRSNSVIAPVSPTGTICFSSLVPTDIVVDLNGWLPS